MLSEKKTPQTAVLCSLQKEENIICLLSYFFRGKSREQFVRSARVYNIIYRVILIKKEEKKLRNSKDEKF